MPHFWGTISGSEVIVKLRQVNVSFHTCFSSPVSSVRTWVELVSKNCYLFNSILFSPHPAMLKSIVRAAGAAVRVSSVTSSATTRTLPFSCAALCSPCSVTTQPITRALWMLSNNGTSTGYRPKLFSSKVMNPSVSCGCGALHTEGKLT